MHARLTQNNHTSLEGTYRRSSMKIVPMHLVDCLRLNPNSIALKATWLKCGGSHLRDIALCTSVHEQKYPHS